MQQIYSKYSIGFNGLNESGAKFMIVVPKKKLTKQKEQTRSGKHYKDRLTNYKQSQDYWKLIWALVDYKSDKQGCTKCQ